MTLSVSIPKDKINEFCDKWKITELSLFGSITRDDFGPESDVDILVTFEPAVKWKLGDWFAMEDELEAIFGRSIDLLIRPEVDYIKNPIRRKSILEGVLPLYAR